MRNSTNENCFIIYYALQVNAIKSVPSGGVCAGPGEVQHHLKNSWNK